MPTSVRISDDFYNEASTHAKAESRSIPKQIEHWSKIGRIMMDNPDLTYEFVKATLLSKEEVKHGMVKKYVRRTKRD